MRDGGNLRCVCLGSLSGASRPIAKVCTAHPALPHESCDIPYHRSRWAPARLGVNYLIKHIGPMRGTACASHRDEAIMVIFVKISYVADMCTFTYSSAEEIHRNGQRLTSAGA